MALTITVVHGPEFLLVEAKGSASLGDMCGLVDFVRATSESHGHSRALLNLVEVQIEFSFTDHLALGSHAASQLRGMSRVASVVDARLRVGTSEKAAQKMGLTLRTFTDLEEARRWVAEK